MLVGSSTLSGRYAGILRPTLLVSLIHTQLPPPRPAWCATAATAAGNPLISLLDRCVTLVQLKQVQAQMLLTGLMADGFAASRLVAACSASPPAGDLGYCRVVLGSIDGPNVFSWNAAIRGHSDRGHLGESVTLYKQMLRSGARPNHLTHPFLFKVCAKTADLPAGCQLFGHALQLGLGSDVFVSNAAIHMLATCGKLDHARQLFDDMSSRDLVSWNSLINGFVRRSRPDDALELFREMEVEKVVPDEVTMIAVVSCCAMLGDLDLGRKYRRYIEEKGLQLTVPLTNALMDMYVKCGSLEHAQRLFDDREMKTVVTWTTMLAGYLKIGSLDRARKLFDDMPSRDIVSWNVMIGGCVQLERARDALNLFHEMQDSRIEPDEITMVNVLSACAQLGAHDMGLWVDHFMTKCKFHLNVELGTALVDMYAKCGNLDKACSVFRDMRERNELTWTAMISGLAIHGRGQAAIRHFSMMVDSGLVPDGVAFLGVLSACCHSGLVDEGRHYFDQMQSKYSLLPSLKHYSCMVDLLGRSGFLDEAENLVRSMPMNADAIVWSSLFFACRFHGNVTMGEHAALQLLKLDTHDTATYVLLASMYVEASLWSEADKVRAMMRHHGLGKIPGCSSIEVNGFVNEFTVRDKSHPQCNEIYACLMQFSGQLDHRC
uniref:Pentatricopeptide repeat-containing protein At2g22410, mitochondrial n=1 Tax=Anthurium amnicola TaxID=1678845 RepID=A0A1D1Z596_9ARAE